VKESKPLVAVLEAAWAGDAAAQFALAGMACQILPDIARHDMHRMMNNRFRVP
jgi:hypothetical protein